MGEIEMAIEVIDKIEIMDILRLVMKLGVLSERSDEKNVMSL